MFEKSLTKELKKIRKKIPAEYNHVEFLDYLADNDVNKIFSITTRGDGKSFNTLSALAQLNVSLDFCTCVFTRHAEIRTAMILQIQDAYRETDGLDINKLAVVPSMDVTLLNYGDKTAFLIVDLNNANDLKNYAAILRQANVTLYDEFLAIGGEYTNNEYLKFKTIFETIDRGTTPAMQYTNNKRKAIFLGNPVDFGSEFLAHYDLYERLHKQEMNTIEKKGDIVIERRRNNIAQQSKNSGMFHDDESVTGEFTFNDWQIKKHNNQSVPISIKTQENYILIYDDYHTIISVKPIYESYSFNTELKDNSTTSTYLDPQKFYRENFYKKYNKKQIFFENQYSKDFILKNFPQLNIIKILKLARPRTEPTIEQETQKLEYLENEQLKRSILNQYFN